MYVSTSVMNVGLILVWLTYIHLPLSAYFGLFTIHLRFYICLCLYAPFLVSTHSKACMFTYMLHVFVNIPHTPHVFRSNAQQVQLIFADIEATLMQQQIEPRFKYKRWVILNTICIDSGINYYHDHYFDHDCNHRFYHE